MRYWLKYDRFKMISVRWLRFEVGKQKQLKANINRIAGPFLPQPSSEAVLKLSGLTPRSAPKARHVFYSPIYAKQLDF
jgi:hypothetical protein